MSQHYHLTGNSTVLSTFSLLPHPLTSFCIPSLSQSRRLWTNTSGHSLLGFSLWIKRTRHSAPASIIVVCFTVKIHQNGATILASSHAFHRDLWLEDCLQYAYNWVMAFHLIDALPAVFQALVNNVFRDMLVVSGPSSRPQTISSIPAPSLVVFLLPRSRASATRNLWREEGRYCLQGAYSPFLFWENPKSISG